MPYAGKMDKNPHAPSLSARLSARLSACLSAHLPAGGLAVAAFKSLKAQAWASSGYKVKAAPKKKWALALACLLPLALSLAGCGSAPGDGYDPKELTPNEAKTIAPEDQVRGAEDPPVVVLKIGEKLRGERLKPDEALPEKGSIGPINLEAVPVVTALQAVLAGEDIPVSLDSEAADTVADRLVTVYNLSGNVAQTVSRICQIANVFCGFRNGIIEIREKETFVIDMPPIPAAAEDTISAAIEKLADGEVITDQTGGNIIYTATTAGHARVQEYLTQLRNGRPLVVLQLYIWEVTLNDTASSGINWRAAKIANIDAGSSAINLSSGQGITSIGDAQGAPAKIGQSISFGAVFSGAVNASTIFSFLSSQGSVQTVSNPQLTFVSGGSAEFVVGGKQTYVSQVGQLVANNVTGDGNSTSTGVGQNTVTTDKVETGLTIKASGNYETGVFLGNLEIKETILVNLESVPTGATVIQLPQTQDRQLKTVLRVRPGDNLLLAGLKSSRDSRSRRGIPTGFGTLPNYGAQDQENRELVILIRPSVVLFSDKADQETETAATPGVDWPAPVVIQGAGDNEAQAAQGPSNAAQTGNILPSNFGSAPQLPPAPADEGAAPVPVVIPAPESLQGDAALPQNAGAAAASATGQSLLRLPAAGTAGEPINNDLVQDGFAKAITAPPASAAAPEKKSEPSKPATKKKPTKKPAVKKPASSTTAPASSAAAPASPAPASSASASPETASPASASSAKAEDSSAAAATSKENIGQEKMEAASPTATAPGAPESVKESTKTESTKPESAKSESPAPATGAPTTDVPPVAPSATPSATPSAPPSATTPPAPSPAATPSQVPSASPAPVPAPTPTSVPTLTSTSASSPASSPASSLSPPPATAPEKTSVPPAAPSSRPASGASSPTAASTAPTASAPTTASSSKLPAPPSTPSSAPSSATSPAPGATPTPAAQATTAGTATSRATPSSAAQPSAAPSAPAPAKDPVKEETGGSGKKAGTP